MNQDDHWLFEPAATLDDAIRKTAKSRQNNLTKPPGSLGRLEEIAVRLATMQGTAQPGIDQACISVFVGDHGVVAEGVSAFPQSVTNEMVKNFARGGAAISVLAEHLDIKLTVINLGTVNDSDCPEGVINLQLGPGTANFCQQPAMRKEQLSRALGAGRQAAINAELHGSDLFIGGEMGIGNTTSATALGCVLLDVAAEQLAGPGTGLDTQGVAHKCQVIHQALTLHAQSIQSPLEALRCVGGFEIAALVGSYIQCAQMGLAVLVDGFICSVAALTACRLCSRAGDWFIYSHRSAEPGHALVLEALDANPLLDLELRLGEGSGAATAVPLLRLACALHNNMATFAEAGIPERSA